MQEIYVPIENLNVKFKDQDRYLQKQKKLKRMQKPCPKFILALVNIFYKILKHHIDCEEHMRKTKKTYSRHITINI